MNWERERIIAKKKVEHSKELMNDPSLDQERRNLHINSFLKYTMNLRVIKEYEEFAKKVKFKKTDDAYAKFHYGLTMTDYMFFTKKQEALEEQLTEASTEYEKDHIQDEMNFLKNKRTEIARHYFYFEKGFCLAEAAKQVFSPKGYINFAKEYLNSKTWDRNVEKIVYAAAGNDFEEVKKLYKECNDTFNYLGIAYHFNFKNDGCDYANLFRDSTIFAHIVDEIKNNVKTSIADKNDELTTKVMVEVDKLANEYKDIETMAEFEEKNNFQFDTEAFVNSSTKEKQMIEKEFETVLKN